MKITHLFFDIGEVVLTNDWDFLSTPKTGIFVKTYGITDNMFMDARKRYIKILQAGQMDESTYFRKCLDIAGATTTDPSVAQQIMRKYQRYKPGMRQLLMDLKKRYSLNAVTDTHWEIFRYKVKRFGLDVIFDRFYPSCETGMFKSSPDIFKYIIWDLKIPSEACVFIDDTVKNVISATSVGLHVIVYHNTPQLIRDLKNFGVC